MSKKKIVEKDVKAVVKKLVDEAAKHIPLYTLCPMTFGYGESGHPDRILLIDGYLYGIECKKDKNNSHTRPELKATKSEISQKKQLRNIVAAGGDVLIIHKDNLQELKDVLEHHTGKKLKTKVQL